MAITVVSFSFWDTKFDRLLYKIEVFQIFLCHTILKSKWNDCEPNARFIFRFLLFVSFVDEVTKISCHFQAKTVQLTVSFFVKMTKNEKWNELGIIDLSIRKIPKKISFWYRSQINPTAINTYRRDVLSLADRDRKATCKIKKEAIAYTRLHTTASLWVMGGISGYISSHCYSGLLELETLGILFHSVLLHSTTSRV